MFKSRLFYTLCLLMLLATDVSAEWNNYVINYKKELFGKGSQTWQIEAFNENWVYFANKNGLLLAIPVICTHPKSEYITPNVPLVSLTNVPDISLLNVPLFTGCN